MLRSPTAIGENFFQNEKKLSQIIFFIENVGFFLFSFPSFLNRFFFERFFPLHFIFFWFVNDLTDFVGFVIYFFFHSYEET